MYHATYDLAYRHHAVREQLRVVPAPGEAIPLFAICGLLGHPVPVYRTGRNRREWIHVDDHDAALLVLLRRRGVEGETFNIGTGERRSTWQIARAVVDAVGAPRDLIRLTADRPGHVLSHAVDSGRLRRAIGWRHTRTLEEELPRTVAWYRAHPSWWRAILLGSAREYFGARHPKLLARVRSRSRQIRTYATVVAPSSHGENR